MTTESQEQPTATTPAPDSSLPDWYLQSLVDMVNGKDFEFPITLFVGGLIVSGQLTSGHKYFEGLGEQLTQFFGGPSDDTAKTIKYFTSPADIYTQPKGTTQTPPPQYIHLRGAKIFTPGQQPIPAEGAWWRGRLVSVDGFHFGSLAITENHA